MPFLDVPAQQSTPAASFLLNGGDTSSSSRALDSGPSLVLPGGGRAASDGRTRTETITPLPGFVLKSSLDGSSPIPIPSQASRPTFAAGTKLFINVAHHAAIPEPPRQTIATGVEDVLLPAVVGEMGVTVDKAGKPSLVLDAVYHSSVLARAKADAQYKLFLIQVVLEKVEDQFEIELSRDYATPKTLASKGPLSPRTVVLPANGSAASPSSAPLITPAPPSSSSTPAAPSRPLAQSATPPPPAHDSSSKPALTYPTPSTFHLTFPLPPSYPYPQPSAPPPARETLTLLPPRTVALSLPGREAVRVQVGREGGSVLEDGLGAEWVVERGRLEVKGRLGA